jgi:hypothetical protein
MSVELTHLGEPLVAGMLNALAADGRLGDVRCADTGVSLGDDLGANGVELIGDRAALRIEGADRTYSGDGMQRVDVLAATASNAVALELKLGLKRMSIEAFRERFCGTCGLSSHRESRITGSMVAVLDGLLPFTASRVFAVDGSKTWPLAKNWWLVLRQSVWDRWQSEMSEMKSEIESPVRNARILAFDKLASLYGTQDEFDRFVLATVGSDFARRWQIDWATNESST